MKMAFLTLGVGTLLITCGITPAQSARSPASLPPPTAEYAWPGFAPIFSNGVRVTHEGCNTLAYGSYPNFGNFMIGRAINGDPFLGDNGELYNHSCSFPTASTGSNSLTWVEHRWDEAVFIYRYTILDTSDPEQHPVLIENGKHQIYSAYDATITAFGGDYLVAFECAIGNATATCVGPLKWDASRKPNGHSRPDIGPVIVDTSRTSVVVASDCPPKHAVCHAASVPKIVAHKDALYLYWDDLAFDGTGAQRNDYSAGGAKTFISSNIRGTRLSEGAGGRYYALSTGATIETSSDLTSTEVLANADGSQVISYQDRLIMTGELTKAGTLGPSNAPTNPCIMGLNDVPHCYRLFFAQAPAPLAYHGFQLIPSEGSGLPLTSDQDGIINMPAFYNRFVYRAATGQTMLSGGGFDSLIPKAATTPATPFQFSAKPSYDFIWPDKLLKPVCDPVNQPFPRFMEIKHVCVSVH